MRLPIATISILLLASPAGVAFGHPAGAGGMSAGAQAAGGAGMNASARTPTPITPNTVRGPALTGQPKQSCSNFPAAPGNAANAPGSAFNPSGQAGSVYAGNGSNNNQNRASVSQYDVACSNQK